MHVLHKGVVQFKFSICSRGERIWDLLKGREPSGVSCSNDDSVNCSWITHSEIRPSLPLAYLWLKNSSSSSSSWGRQRAYGCVRLPIHFTRQVFHKSYKCMVAIWLERNCGCWVWRMWALEDSVKLHYGTCRIKDRGSVTHNRGTK